MKVGSLPTGTLGPYIGADSAQVCRAGLRWFISDIIQASLDVDMITDQVSSSNKRMQPLEITARATVEVTVGNTTRNWQIRAHAQPVEPGSTNFYLTRIVVHDTTRKGKVHHCTLLFGLDPETYRSSLVGANWSNDTMAARIFGSD